MDTGSFPCEKRPQRGVNNPTHLTPMLQKEDSYTYTLPLRFHGRLQGELVQHYVTSIPATVIGLGGSVC